MGAWGYGAFENDEVFKDLSLLQETIELVLDDKYIDATDATNAIGAIEILAALQNRPSNDINENEEIRTMGKRT
ncbi:DUF4259 domain-containing protein [Paenibacillus mesophilus]|uniref:DUF4259 domain-containing protein n=1 Tax=Paenibacillus mesophilus TaxID=2582849 RepID=UPI00110F6706|nr:DUF4259 domain-containing protein [Paenibacillus mesophilus]TMV50677.1 DUF4259 domain-containing protein [Paenibacillus mesophilus]